MNSDSLDKLIEARDRLRRLQSQKDVLVEKLLKLDEQIFNEQVTLKHYLDKL